MKLFAGPCSLESKEICFEVARTIREHIPSGVDYYFKTSFAKENRSSSTSFMCRRYSSLYTNRILV